jgi:hypothetical protein
VEHKEAGTDVNAAGTHVVQRMWPSRGAILGVLFATLGRAGIARGQEAGGDREAIHVLALGSATCLSEPWFFEQVEARTSRVRRADAGTTARTFVVSVKPEAGGFVGRLVVVEPTGQTEPRVVHASTCDQAASGLALIAAVSIDALAQEPTHTAPPVAPPAPTPPPVAPLAPLVPAAPDASAAAPPRDAPSWTFAAGGSAAPMSLPDAGLGFGAFVDVTREAPGIFAPELRLSGARTAGATVNTSVRSGQPIWLTLDLSFCPLRTARRVLSACADIEGGALHVDASTAGASSPSRPWIAPGLGGRISFPDLSIASRLQLLVDLDLAVRAPLVRDTFYFLDNPSNFQVYRTPVLVARGEIDVGLRFW